MDHVPFWHTASVQSIGKRIRAARKAQGLSQPAVAREAGCSLATYKRYEQIDDLTPPEGFQYLWRIAELLGIDLRGAREADDPDNPRLLEATELQLAAELHRRVAVRAVAEGDDTPRAPIDVADMPVSTQRDDNEADTAR